jgi:hypothetical protein
LVTGIRYRFTPNGETYRTTWPLKKGKQARDTTGTFVEESGHGCTKKRSIHIGHRQRSWLWIWSCLEHDHVIGFHVIKNSEGMRDPLSSLYRHLPTAPSYIFIDFSCGMQEVCENWLPVYFKDSSFFHDTFHGSTHICGPSFNTDYLDHLQFYNTSQMEQVSLATNTNITNTNTNTNTDTNTK